VNPNSARTCNNLARAYLTAPTALRDVAAALPLAEKAMRLTGGSASCRNTMGLAYYRAGRYCEAVEVLRPNLEHQDETLLAFDLYILAMSHHRLGEAARARDYYTWAVRWVDATVRWAQGQRSIDPAFLDELAAFRAEAEGLLEIGRKND
jgi:tetratricopeptide (TPR) repeat protein